MSAQRAAAARLRGTGGHWAGGWRRRRPRAQSKRGDRTEGRLAPAGRRNAAPSAQLRRTGQAPAAGAPCGRAFGGEGAQDGRRRDHLLVLVDGQHRRHARQHGWKRAGLARARGGTLRAAQTPPPAEHIASCAERAASDGGPAGGVGPRGTRGRRTGAAGRGAASIGECGDSTARPSPSLPCGPVRNEWLAHHRPPSLRETRAAAAHSWPRRRDGVAGGQPRPEKQGEPGSGSSAVVRAGLPNSARTTQSAALLHLVIHLFRSTAPLPLRKRRARWRFVASQCPCRGDHSVASTAEQA